MKKHPIFFLLLLTAFVASVNACKKNNQVVVTPTPPKSQPQPPQPLDFTASGYLAGVPVNFTVNRKTYKTISWDFGDGSPVLLTGPGMFEHVYGAGTYTVTMIVDGDSAAAVRKPLVIKPNYSFTVSADTVVGDTIAFTSYAYPATGNTYSWSFGDGATSTEANPTHVYPAHGTYKVVLAVNGDKDFNAARSVSIVQDPIHTQHIAGTRLWHDCKTKAYTTNAGVVTTYHGDSTIAIEYINKVTLKALGDVFTYNPAKSVGGMVYYWPGYGGITAISDPESAYIIYDPLKDSISIKNTVQGTVHGSSGGGVFWYQFTGYWKQ